MTYDFSNMHFSLKDICQENLSAAFIWENAPKGYAFWSGQYVDGLTDDGIALWQDMNDVFTGKPRGASVQEDPSGMYMHQTGDTYLRVFERDFGTAGKRLVGFNFAFEWFCINSKGTRVASIPSDAVVIKDKINYGTFEEFSERMVSSEYESDYAYDNLMEAVAICASKHRLLYMNDTYIGRVYFRSLMRDIYQVSECKDKDFISIYRTHKDYLKGRKTELKVGRAIRWMFPELSDSAIEDIVKEYKDLVSDKEYTLHTGSTREAFRHAYSDELSRSYNPRTNSARKSLHNSCMRGISLGSKGISPAEVYASGDFHIAWLECDSGKIAGRVVVRNGSDTTDPQAGPVYGVCESSLNALEEYLDSISAVKYEDNSTWLGAKVRKITIHGDLVGPYSDLETELEDHGEHLVFERHGTIEFTSTSGYANEENTEYCEDCGDRFNMEHEGAYVDDHGCICQSCLENDYVFVDDCHDYVHVSDAIPVHSKGRFGTNTSWYLKDSEDVVYCQCVDQYWEIDDTMFSEKYEDFVPTHLADQYPEMFEEEEEEAA